MAVTVCCTCLVLLSCHFVLTGIAIPEDPPTPLWELILEQFKDQLVLILLGSAAVSFVLALFEEDGGWSAFVDPAVVSISIPPTTDLANLFRFLPFLSLTLSLVYRKRAVLKKPSPLFKNTLPTKPM